jgi:UDP-N-acetylmuramate dehydrogenase
VNTAAFRDRLHAVLGADAVREGESLAPYTTFHVGGPADWCVTVTTRDELQTVITAAHECEVPITILGGGSNVVIADEGLRGAVIRPHLTTIDQPAPDRVRADAGVTMNGLVRWTVSRGLASLEAWAGTPGTVGGAIYGNAHYGGRNIGDLVRQVEVLSAAGESSVVPASAMGFAYDTSRLQRTREILVWAEFAVTTASPEALRSVARKSLHHRKQTQPLALPSAGCLFQNPDPARDPVPAGMPASAGALIDAAGMKGFRVGGAMISVVHANFVVNDRSACAADIHALAAAARTAVRERFGVELRDEVVYLGRF